MFQDKNSLMLTLNEFSRDVNTKLVTLSFSGIARDQVTTATAKKKSRMSGKFWAKATRISQDFQRQAP